MRPILFELGPLKVWSYGFMLMLGFTAGLGWGFWKAPRLKLERERVLDLGLYVLLSALIGARLVYVMLHLDEYDSLSSLFMVWEGGLSFHGGFFGGLLVAWAYTRITKTSFVDYADLLAPGIALGTAFARIGCTLNGCCHGGPSTAWCAIPTRFLDGEHVVPTQLMELVGCLLLFFLLWRLVDHRRFKAQVFLAYVMGYAVVRGAVEYWRAGFTADFFLGPLTQAQALSIALFLIALVFYLMLSRKARREA